MKKLLPFALCSLFVLAIGQTSQAQVKVGYISLQELIGKMPEYKKAETDMADYTKALNDQLNEYRLEHYIKDSISNVDSPKWTAAVRDVKRQELQKLAIKVYTYQQDAQKLLQEKEQALIAPIQQKAVQTTQAVGKENGYTYILSKEQLIMFPATDDLLPLVAKKLGIKLDAPTAAAPPKPTGK